MSRMTRPDDHFIELIKRSGSVDKNEALVAQHELAVALETPLRKGVLVGDVLDGIFEKINMEPGTAAEFRLIFSPPVLRMSMLLIPTPATVVFQNERSKAITSWFRPIA